MVFDGKLLLTDDIHVASALPSSTSSFGINTESATPPWHLVHFDVHCPRCGHDLRGQIEPVCPACRLEFSWADAAPLEQLTCDKCNYHLYGLADSRCPECGTAVDWNAALLRYRRREKPLFEYCWRERPIRSFVRTWFLALLPGRLWRSIDIHDPPMVLPLCMSALIYLIVAGLIFPIGLGLMNWWWMRSRTAAPFAPAVWDIPSYVLSHLTGFASFIPLTMLLLFGIFAFFAFQLFQQSMAKCRIRRVHVLRVVVLSVIAYFPFAALTYVAMEWGFRFVRGLSRWNSSMMYEPLWLVTAPFIWLVPMTVLATVVSGTAYRKYLKMPHSRSVATASHCIAILSVAAIISVLARMLLISL